MTLILEKLTHAYHNYCVEHYGNAPEVIILHPGTCYQCMDDLMNYIKDYSLMSEPRFNGVKIYRSSDIKENEIIVR